MDLVEANERRGQKTGGSLECDNTIFINFTCTTEETPNLNVRSTMEKDNIFEKEAEKRNFTEQFETNGQNNINNVLNSSTLIKNKNFYFKDVEQEGNIKVKCNDLSGNMSDIFQTYMLDSLTLL